MEGYRIGILQQSGYSDTRMQRLSAKICTHSSYQNVIVRHTTKLFLRFCRPDKGLRLEKHLIWKPFKRGEMRSLFSCHFPRSRLIKNGMQLASFVISQIKRKMNWHF